MKMYTWRLLGLPGPIFQRGKDGIRRSPYRIYRIWDNMKSRGGLTRRKSYPRDRHAKYYMHVIVCDEWRDFANFYRWAVTHGYREDLTLDRIDWRRGYCPENCRWATYSEQNKNRCMTEKWLRQVRSVCRLGGLAAAAARRLKREERNAAKSVHNA